MKMKMFLDLTFYKNRESNFPNHLKPTIDSNLIGIITHYVELSENKYGKASARGCVTLSKAARPAWRTLGIERKGMRPFLDASRFSS